MLKIYHVPGTRSVRPIWLCYELELPVEIEPIDFSVVFRNSPEWRSISPAGKVPVMRDDALTLFESGAMVDYILERYGKDRLRPPPGTFESALYRQWCWFSEATLSRPMGLRGLLRAENESGAVVAEAAAQKARECLVVVEQAVAGSEYLLGDVFSAADIMMGYSLQFMGDILDDRYSGTRAYLDRLKNRGACQRAFGI